MGYRFTIYSLFMDIHNSFLDIHDSLLDIHNSFLDIHDSFLNILKSNYGYPKIQSYFWISIIRFKDILKSG